MEKQVYREEGRIDEATLSTPISATDSGDPNHTKMDSHEHESKSVDMPLHLRHLKSYRED